MKERNNLRLTLAGIAVSGLGTNLYAFAISFYILTITGSANSFALSLILSVLPRVILNPIVGNLVDRINKKLLVVMADALSGLLMIGLFLFTKSNDLSLAVIYISSFASSVLYVFLNTSFKASYGSIVSEKYITKMNSFSQSIQAILQIASPILGGMIYATVDIRLFFLINGISFFLSSITECFIDFNFNKTVSSEPKASNSFVQDFKEGLVYVRSQKMYFSLAIYILFINFFLSSFSVIVPYTLITIHGFNASVSGLIQSTFPVGMLLMSLYVGYKNLTFSKKQFANSLVIFAITLIVFSLPSMSFIHLNAYTPYYYGIVFMVIAANAISINVPLGSKLQTSIDENYRGRFFGILGMFSEGIMPVSYLLVGFLIGIVPTYVILLTSSGALLLISLHVRRNGSLDESTEEVNPSVQYSS